MNPLLHRCRKLTVMLPYLCSFKLFPYFGKKFFQYKLSFVPMSTLRESNRFLKYNFVFALSLVQFLEATGLKKQSELEKALSRAKTLLQDGKINEACDLYKSALPLAIKEQDNDLIFTIKEKIAVIAFSSQQYPEAEILFLSAKEKLIENGATLDDIHMLYVNLRLAETYDFLHNPAKAEEHYKLCSKGVKMKSNEIQKLHSELVEFCLMFLISRAHYSLRRGDINRAHKYFTRAYELCIQIRDEVNEQSVTLLQQLGSVTYQKGDLEGAIVHLKKATELGRHLPGMVELANAYISLGNIYLVQGLFDAAARECSQGLKNSERHNYELGIKEAANCLEEIKKFAKS